MSNAIDQLLNLTDPKHQLGFDIPSWVQGYVVQHMRDHRTDYATAYLHLLDQGLPVDSMWAIDAALYEMQFAMVH